MDTIIMVWTTKCMEGARWMVGSCWVSRQIKIKIMNALFLSFYD
jgi:hypothetical protein